MCKSHETLGRDRFPKGVNRAIAALILLSFLSILVLGGCERSHHSAQIITPLQNIVFVSDRDGNEELYGYVNDLYAATNLTSNTGNDASPALSHDGSLIAFSSNRDGNYEIYLMNRDGTNVQRLTHDAAEDDDPCFCPDDQMIAFSTNRDGNWEIYAMNLDGSGQINLTNHPGDDRDPAWSETWIAFESRRPETSLRDIYLMHENGSNQIDSTNTLAQDESDPAWCPDNQYLAFARTDGARQDIYVVGVDAAGQPSGEYGLTLQGTADINSDPCWCPEGKYILFETNLNGNSDIYRMLADGTEPNTWLEYTLSTSNEDDPSWGL